MFATGRTPNTGDLGLEEVGVKTGRGGGIVVDDWLKTSVPNIYALGDVSEMKAVTTFFGSSSSHLHVSATKSATGHMLGAAGAAEAVICIKTIAEGIIPPTINTRTIDPQMPGGLNIVLGQSIEKDVKVALSNTFGFGGHNASAVFRKFTP